MDLISLLQAYEKASEWDEVYLELYSCGAGCLYGAKKSYRYDPEGTYIYSFNSLDELQFFLESVISNDKQNV